MAEITDVRKKVRRALGDVGARFRETFPGGDDEYEIGRTRIGSVRVEIVDGTSVTLVPEEDYTLDAAHGVVTFDTAIPDDPVVRFTGVYYGLFEDWEIDDFIDAAVLRHTHEREHVTRYREEKTGFIRYKREPYTLETLPPVEDEALVVMATILALYEMATDAASDIDVWTAEGTHLARGQRFNQLMEMIDTLMIRYRDICNQLNIGINKIEMSTLRRVSKLTGRLVPVFREREYDEAGPGSYPSRLLPPIDSPHEDESGLPSPIWGPY